MPSKYFPSFERAGNALVGSLKKNIYLALILVAIFIAAIFFGSDILIIILFAIPVLIIFAMVVFGIAHIFGMAPNYIKNEFSKHKFVYIAIAVIFIAIPLVYNLAPEVRVVESTSKIYDPVAHADVGTRIDGKIYGKIGPFRFYKDTYCEGCEVGL